MIYKYDFNGHIEIMEKLIELLNEYNSYYITDEYCDPIYDEEGNRIKANPRKYMKYKKEFEFLGKPFIQYKGLSEESAEFKIISKKFGFIKWLVDNDKIDLQTLADKKYEIYDYEFAEDYNDKNYETLLMLLSIQDNPIQFLVDILK